MIKLDVYVLFVKYSYDDGSEPNSYLLGVYQTLEGAKQAAQKRYEMRSSIVTPIPWNTNDALGWAGSNLLDDTEYTIERMGVQQ